MAPRPNQGGGFSEKVPHPSEAESAMQALVRTAPIAMGLVINGVICEVNQSACEMLGGTREELIGQSAQSVYPAQDNFELDRARVFEQLRATGKATIEIRLQRKDGTMLDVLLGSTALDPADLSKGMAYWAMDITERKRNEAALRMSEQRFGDIAEASGELIWEVDAEGMYTYVNRSCRKLLGYDEEEVVGRLHFYDLHPPEGREDFRRDSFEYFAKRVPFVDYVNPVLTKDGRVLEVLTSGVPVLAEDGCLLGYRGSDRDITAHKRDRERLAKEAAWRRLLLSQSRDGIVVLDENGKAYEANHRYAEMLGYPMEELLQLHVWDWDAQWDREHLLEMIQLVDEKGDHFETRHRRKDGTCYDTEISSSGTLWGGEKYILCICRDISSRKASEAALRHSENCLKLAMAASHMGVWEWNTRTGTVDILTDHFDMPGTKEFGRTAQAGIDLLYPDDAPRFLESLAKAMADKTLFAQEYRIRPPGGDVRWLSTLGQIEYDEAGNPLSMVGTVQDITDRKQAEDELRASEAKYRTLVQNMSQGVFYQLADGTFLDANPAALAMFGLDREEFLRRTPWDRSWRITGENGSRLQGAEHPCMVALASGKPVRDAVIGVFNPKLQSDVWMVVNAIPEFRPGEERPYRISVTLHDITDRRRAEQERRQLEMQLFHAQRLESVGVMAGGMAHDFNNILAGIRAYADLLQADCAFSTTARQRVAEIQKATKRAADLTRQILTYAGKGLTDLEPLNLSQIVEDMKSMLEVAVSKKAAVHYDLASDLSAVLADAGQIRQVVMNLVVNASEALSDNAGTISISTRMISVKGDHPIVSVSGERFPQGLCVCLEVTDTGCGMDGRVLAKIFDPFFTTKFAGRGLGLAAVHGILVAHRGSIQVSSAVGQGSVFRVLLPVTEAAPLRVQPELPTVVGRRGRGMVLIVDDEEMVREGTRALLVSLGFDALVASDGEEAIRACRQHHDRLVAVILDLTMPVMNGEEVFRELRRMAPDLRIILTSGYTEEAMRQRFASEKVFGFVQKPDPIDTVVATLIESLSDVPDKA